MLFKFRSGTHGLNEEVGRHRGGESKRVCCVRMSESVCHYSVGMFSIITSVDVM